MIRNKLIIGIIAIGLLLIALFYRGLYSPAASEIPITQSESTPKVVVVSTDPSPLEDKIILPTQKIVITLNHPLVNEPEFRHRFEPEVEHVVKLSDDKKTVTITPKTSWNLGTTYTLLIQPLAKFEDGATLEGDIIYHFKTIEYKGV
jgi:hypothetical protein